jgi:EAL domain-containing protein (putative c-di-GMP-specific phosphodiesterase class I)/CheY-like chemotaxis protein
VLVVEDSALQRAHAVALVAGLGAAEVMEARDGLDGLGQLARNQAIDLVLTDLDMPGMDGITFISEFAARGFRPQVIILSSQEAAVIQSVALMAETYGLTVPGVLSKPLAGAGLTSLLAARPLRPGSPTGAAPQGPPRQEPAPAEIARGIRDREFLCFFQPQVTFHGALLKGVEALVRWRHPHLGLLGPAAFLPQVEAREGLMEDLTLAILAHAAEQWHGWRRKGLNLEVSVNLSAGSVGIPGFADVLIAAADRLDLPSRSLVFELTESASVSDLGHTLANLARLRMRGFRLSIDDFGTGFATFEQVERIPFTELKLDRSIVGRLPGSERHLVMAQSLLHLTRGLRLASVAEGIETIEAWACLRDLGCERGQGYLIARPMPGEQLLEWASQDRTFLR